VGAVGCICSEIECSDSRLNLLNASF
jgi:hypothetical protein